MVKLSRVCAVMLSVMASLAFQVQPVAAQTARAQEANAHPGVVLGQRVSSIAAKLPVAPVVVIAQTEADYYQALRQWSLTQRFPVLIDDGTDLAREDIARFVRAFEPERVVVWAQQPPGAPELSPLPVRADEIIAKAWGAAEGQTIEERWAQLKLSPVGVVIAKENAPARTAAVALAAGRGQPLVWTQKRLNENLNGVASLDELRGLEEEITSELRTRGFAWKSLGDIDALTVCVPLSVRVKMPDSKKHPQDRTGLLATTDVLGRQASGVRYAWTGQMMGSAAEAAYDAMCALFLQPRDAMLFDGYNGEPPTYAHRGVINTLEQAGFDVLSPTSTGPGLRGWKRQHRWPIDGGLVMVNSSGHSDWFNLGKGPSMGRATPTDIPALHTPSAVYFIHSFSAQGPGNRQTIARTWLDRGAFVYFGSVDEPYLGAFNPAAVYANRLLAGMPFGVATRQDASHPWKVHVLGDPLWALSSVEADAAEIPQLPGNDAADLTKRAAEARDMGAVVRLLVMRGNDERACTFSKALLEQAKEDESIVFHGSIARAAVHAAARQRDLALLTALYKQLPAEQAGAFMYQSLLWRSLEPGLRGNSLTGSQAELLAANIPDVSILENAKELAPQLDRLQGRGAGHRLYEQLLKRDLPKHKRKQLIEQAP